MKKVIFSFVILSFFITCASSGSTGGAGLTLQEAIEQSAERIVDDLPQGSRIAIVAFDSPNDGLSNFIIEELKGALFDKGIEVVDRQNLEFVRRELHFQMSGEVSDESTVSIGKFLGAEYVITGDFSIVGNVYRYRVNAINVEQAIRASVSRVDVAGGRKMQNMIRTLENHGIMDTSHSENRSTVPRTAGEFLDRGITLASQGEWEMAILDFTEAIQLNPNLIAAFLLRGRAEYASVSDVIDIAEDFERVGAHFSTGRQLSTEQTQAYDRAIADFTESIRLDGNNPIAFSNRGEAYLQKGNLDNAIADFNQAIRLNPRYAWAYNNRGIAFLHREDFDRAIADFTQAIRLDSQFSSPYFNRGNHYLSRNDYDRAIADFTQTIQIDPNHAGAYNNRGWAYFRKENWNRAISDFDHVIRLVPSAVWGYHNRGNAYFHRGRRAFDQRNNDRAREDYRQAIVDYTQAIRLFPNATTYFYRGNAHFGLENFIGVADFALAIADYTESIRLGLNEAEVYFMRGYAYWCSNLESHDRNRAIADFETALRIDPNHSRARRELDQLRR
jgi:tetratricopeptide (TPR) repeat protein